MLHFIHCYLIIMRLRFSAATQYKADFFVGVTGLLLQQIIILLTIAIVFSGVDSLSGFSLNEILFILGLSQLIRGIDMMYNDYVWVEAFGGFSRGSIYAYKTRPLPVYLQILSQRLNTQSLGPIVVGIMILSQSLGEIAGDWKLIDWSILIAFIINGLIILFSIKLMCAVVALYFGKSGELMQVIHEFIEFVKYPVSIYGVLLQALLFTVIPFGLISFLPGLFWFENKPLPLIGNVDETIRPLFVAAYSFGMSSLLLLIALYLWKKGVSETNVTGT